jgi:ankyrin repeat protein
MGPQQKKRCKREIEDLPQQQLQQQQQQQQQLDSLLAQACNDNDLDAATTLVTQGADLNAIVDGKPALHRAIIVGNLQVASMLLEKGANTQTKGEHYVGKRENPILCTPLELAIRWDQLEIAQLLIAKGVFLHTKYLDECGTKAEDGTSCLEPSVKARRIATLMKAFREGVHPSQVSRREEVSRLLQLRNDPAAFEELGEYLRDAAYFGQTETVQRLLNVRLVVDVDDVLKAHRLTDCRSKNGSTPFLMACQEGHVDVVTLLINAEADIKAKNKPGRNALMLASRFGYLPVVKILFGRGGVDLHEREIDGRNAFMLASRTGHLPVVQFLWDKVPDLETRDSCDRTALELASIHGHANVVEFLATKVSKGALNGALDLIMAGAYRGIDLSGREQVKNVLRKNIADVPR